MGEQTFTFGGYYVDPKDATLWRRERALRLKPKAFAVLCVLLSHAGQVVSKDSFFQTVWSDETGSDAALAVCIAELRRTLRDKVKKPQYIETVHRRGYRFIGAVASSQHSVVSSQKAVVSPQSVVSSQDFRPTPNPQFPTPTLVGREAELVLLHHTLNKALKGERQIVFVSGEPGIGKTTLVDAFLKSLESSVQRLESKIPSNSPHDVQTLDPRHLTLDARLWIGHGRCLEQYGEGEAYLPILEAFGRLCREPGTVNLIPLLGQYAPTWLIQMQAVLKDAELANLQQRAQGATRQRMLREMAEALEAMTVETPLVLTLEDLHWSDYSTLELLSYLAQRQERARLMVIGTYRPTDLLRRHPLQKLTHELHVRGQCQKVPLEPLKREDVATYVAARFPGAVGSDVLASAIHRRTEGNALFMVMIVQALIGQGLMKEKDGQWEFQGDIEDLNVSDDLHQLIEQQLERFEVEERRVLEAASVGGEECTAAAIAAAVGREAIEVEECCAEIARHSHFICDRGMSEWPDGTVTARFGFVHTLYQEVLYDRLVPAKRAQLHLRIGERLEQAYGDRRGNIAAALARHFEQGRDCAQAIQYLQQAADAATQRCAYQEAVGYLTRELRLLTQLPVTPERVQQELSLQTSLGMSLMATKGYAAPETKHAYDRAYELCQQVEEGPYLASVLRGLVTFYSARADHQTTRELAERCLALAHREHDPMLLLGAHLGLGAALFSLGDLVQARTHLEQGMALYDPQQHRSSTLLYGYNLGVACLARSATVLWLLGYPEQAVKRSQQALALAQEQQHPFSVAYALSFATEGYRLRREAGVTQAQAEATLTLSTAQGFPLWEAGARIFRGWALAEQGQVEEGIGQLQHGIAAWQATGAALGLPSWLAQLAEAYGHAGQIEEGLTTLTTALKITQQNRESWWEAEVHRLTGELLLAQEGKSQNAKGKSQKSAPPSAQPLAPSNRLEAEACFHRALDLARKQQAKSLELRTVMSLSRLRQQQGKRAEAHQLLAEIYDWFTEGFETADLREARTLLAALSG